jgi:hypothetical protein
MQLVRVDYSKEHYDYYCEIGKKMGSLVKYPSFVRPETRYPYGVRWKITKGEIDEGANSG